MIYMTALNMMNGIELLF